MRVRKRHHEAEMADRNVDVLQKSPADSGSKYHFHQFAEDEDFKSLSGKALAPSQPYGRSTV